MSFFCQFLQPSTTLTVARQQIFKIMDQWQAISGPHLSIPSLPLLHQKKSFFELLEDSLYSFLLMCFRARNITGRAVFNVSQSTVLSFSFSFRKFASLFFFLISSLTHLSFGNELFHFHESAC